MFFSHTHLTLREDLGIKGKRVANTFLDPSFIKLKQPK